MPAERSFRSMGLCASCPPCASGLLAAKVSRSAGLRASDGVRMVRRAGVKDARERFYCRRFSVGALFPPHVGFRAAKGLHVVSSWAANG